MSREFLNLPYFTTKSSSLSLVIKSDSFFFLCHDVVSFVFVDISKIGSSSHFSKILEFS